MPDPKKPGELARDEQRKDDTPRYHGREWEQADREPPPGMTKDEDAHKPHVVVETPHTERDTKRDGARGGKGK